MLNNEIIDEIIFLSNNNKIIDKNFINKIINYVISKTDDITKSKFNKVLFLEIRDTAIAYYIPTWKVIIIDYDKILEMASTYQQNGVSYLKTNLCIMQIILHEVEHIKEEFKSKKLNDLESYIIKSAKLDNFKKPATKEVIKNLGIVKTINMLTTKTRREEFLEKRFDIQTQKQSEAYFYNPCEKIANLDSLKTILTSVSQYPDFIKNNNKLYISLLDIYFDMYTEGYEDNEFGYNIPIIDFFTIMGDTSYLKGIDTYSKNKELFLKNSINKYDSLTRLRLGLPIVRDDLLEVQKKLKKI